MICKLNVLKSTIQVRIKVLYSLCSGSLYTNFPSCFIHKPSSTLFQLFPLNIVSIVFKKIIYCQAAYPNTNNYLTLTLTHPGTTVMTELLVKLIVLFACYSFAVLSPFRCAHKIQEAVEVGLSLFGIKRIWLNVPLCQSNSIFIKENVTGLINDTNLLIYQSIGPLRMMASS